MEQNLIRETQDGYSQIIIRGIKELKFIDLLEEERRNLDPDEVCSICHDIYSNTDN